MTPVSSIRSATHADGAWLAACAVAMALETEARALHPSTVRAGIDAGIADPAKARYYVAVDASGAPVGTLMLTREWSDWRNGHWWWIQSVFVQERQRRRGVFQALYRHVEAEARAAPDVIGLRLYVERENASAQATYAALGMHDAGYQMFEADLTA